MSRRATLLAYARSIGYLRPAQIGWLVVRRGLGIQGGRPAAGSLPLRAGVGLLPPLAPASPQPAPWAFRFLNATRTFPPGAVDWVCADAPKLWRYNLHYFDYLHDPVYGEAEQGRLIQGWIDANPVGRGDGWEPYPVSLRIVNWVTRFLSPPWAGRVPEAWLASLAQQARWLARGLERHLLANHYLKNGKALFFAGAFFDGAEARRWLVTGARILSEEAHEQILADGGHYERSPMYHAIVLEDYLDALNLAIRSPGLVDGATLALWREKAVAALGFLEDLCLPDGRIALFNDAAFGVAPEPAALLDYATRVVGFRPRPREAGCTLSSRPETGYYVMRDGDDAMIVDCGPVGPDYQPGHAHCDTLSYELALAGRRVVVDSGVTDYEASDTRRYARGTRAHNTVTVDGEDQSELWGVFRVARRARPLDASLERLPDGTVRFAGAHDGYTRLAGAPVHRRRIDYRPPGCWEVEDLVEGAGLHRAESFVHLHPDLTARGGDGALAVHGPDGARVADLEPGDGVDVRVGTGAYFPELGLSLANTVITLSASGPLPLRLAYRIRKAGRACRE